MERVEQPARRVPVEQPEQLEAAESLERLETLDPRGQRGPPGPAARREPRAAAALRGQPVRLAPAESWEPQGPLGQPGLPEALGRQEASVHLEILVVLEG